MTKTKELLSLPVPDKHLVNQCCQTDKTFTQSVRQWPHGQAPLSPAWWKRKNPVFRLKVKNESRAQLLSSSKIPSTATVLEEDHFVAGTEGSSFSRTHFLIYLPLRSLQALIPISQMKWLRLQMSHTWVRTKSPPCDSPRDLSSLPHDRGW